MALYWSLRCYRICVGSKCNELKMLFETTLEVIDVMALQKHKCIL